MSRVCYGTGVSGSSYGECLVDAIQQDLIDWFGCLPPWFPATAKHQQKCRNFIWFIDFGGLCTHSFLQNEVFNDFLLNMAINLCISGRVSEVILSLPL